MKRLELYSDEQLEKWYGSRDNIQKLWSDGSLPDPFWLRCDIDEDVNARTSRGEELPAELERKRLIFGPSEPLDDTN